MKNIVGIQKNRIVLLSVVSFYLSKNIASMLITLKPSVSPVYCGEQLLEPNNMLNFCDLSPRIFLSKWWQFYFTSKPSARKHILCASINFLHSGSSSPLKTTHSSLGFLVSGQQQQIALPMQQLKVRKVGDLTYSLKTYINRYVSYLTWVLPSVLLS
jgi:hypothetical protein